MNVPRETWMAVFRRDKGRCQYCGEDLLASVSSYFSATTDHVVPRATGGIDDLPNLVCCCPACNSMLTREKERRTFAERKEFIRQPRQKEQENLVWWREQVGWSQHQ